MEKIFDKIRERISSVNPDEPRKLKGVFQINIESDDGPKTITVDLNKLEVQDDAGETPDVTVDVDADTFVQVAKNEITFCEAMQSGRAKFSGCAELAKSLGKVLSDKPLGDE